MSMDQSLLAFFDELEKLGVSKNDASFMQARRGRRPIRAHKLLEKETAFKRPPKSEDGADEAKDSEHEYGGGMEDKLGAAPEDKPEKWRLPNKKEMMQAAVTARPWVASTVKGAVPAAIATRYLIPAVSPKAVKYKTRAIAAMGVLGGMAGATDLALRRWAEKHPRSSMAKEIKKQGSADTMRKVAAMAADLRRTGLGKTQRPPFATEDSKQFSFNQLKNSKAPGYFTTQTQPRHLKKPGPSIKQLAPGV